MIEIIIMLNRVKADKRNFTESIEKLGSQDFQWFVLTKTEINAGRKSKKDKLKRQKLRTDGDGKFSNEVLITTCCVPHIIATALSTRKLFDIKGEDVANIEVSP